MVVVEGNMAKQIPAKFGGVCRACGGSFPAGAQILWAKGEGSRHVTCPVGASKADTTTPAPHTLTLACDYRPIHDGMVGETIRMRARKGELGAAVTVVRQRAQYVREDGLSFGLGDDSGWLLTLECRDATPEEAAKLEAREAASRKAAEEAAAKAAAEKTAKQAAADAYKALRAEKTAGLVDAGEAFDGTSIAERRQLATHDDYYQSTLFEVTFTSGAIGYYETSFGHDDSRSRLWGPQAEVEAAWKAWQARVNATPAQAREWVERYGKCSGNEFYRWLAAQEG